jgi:hypothetical protein
MEMPDEQKQMIDRAMFLRGRMITHFAQCEYLLADISVRVDRRFIYLLKKRVKAVEAITSEGGPYAKYAADIVPLANQLLAWDDIRNFLAHGMIFLLYVQKRQSFVFEFRRYTRSDDQKFQHMNWFISLDELEEASNALADVCDKFIKAFRSIYIEENLEGKFPELFE